MSTDLSNTTALVTGGGVGIGRQIALRLARAGARVAVTYRSHEPESELITALAAASDPVMLQIDATSEADVAALASTMSERFGTLDVLVNNVGGLVKRATLAELDLRLWREVMAVNLDSTYLVTRALAAVDHPGAWARDQHRFSCRPERRRPGRCGVRDREGGHLRLHPGPRA